MKILFQLSLSLTIYKGICLKFSHNILFVDNNIGFKFLLYIIKPGKNPFPRT